MTKLITILGPTASGKTKLATHLAYTLGGEIISADSRQVFKGMDIGTGKDLNEYIIKGKNIPYHLIDHRNAGERYNVNAFQKDFEKAYYNVLRNEKTPILCGGTGYYIQAVLQNFTYTHINIQPEQRLLLETKDKHVLIKEFQPFLPYFPQADLSSKKRIIRAFEIAQHLKNNPGFSTSSLKLDPLIIGLKIDRDKRKSAITKRLYDRMDGMIGEVKNLLTSGIPNEDLKFYGLEYKFVTEYLEGKWSLELMTERLNTAIHQFSKRQMTYFRKMEKDGLNIHWIDALLPTNEQIELIKKQFP